MSTRVTLENLYTKFGRFYPKGSVIFWENEPGEEMFIILSGKVQINKKVSKTKEQTLAVISDGDFFGEMSLLEDKPRSATAVCVSDTKLIVLNKQNFRTIMEKEPRFAYKMLIILSKRLRTLNKYLEEKGLTKVVKEIEEEKKEIIKEEVEEEIKKEEVIIKGEIEEIEEKEEPQLKYLHDLATSFIPSILLFTAIKFDIISFLELNPTSLNSIVEKLNSDSYATALLLNALVNLNILRKDNDTYSLSTLSTEFLLKEKISYIGEFINLLATTQNNWQDLERVIKEGKSEKLNENFLREFIQNKNIEVQWLINKLTAICDLSFCKRLLEIGNNPAAYACQLASILKNINATVIDYQKNIETIDEYIAQFGLTERVVAQIGDYKEASFGKNQDIIIFSFIMHEDQNKNIKFIENAYDALNNNGYLVIHDYILRDDKLSPQEVVILGLNLLLTQNAKIYSFSELNSIINNMGFRIIEGNILPDNTAYIIAQKKKEKK